MIWDSGKSRFDRSDYLSTFEAGGADALNKLLRQRYPVEEVRMSEMTRMEKSGVWEVAWDLENGTALILGRHDRGR